MSLLYAGGTVLVELLLGLGIALLLQRRTRLNNAISILLLLPLMTAPALAALMWKLMTNANFGVLSYLAARLGFPGFQWASAPETALLTVILVDVWVYTPFMMILLLAGLRSLPRQPFEAAALDGVPRSFVFWRITLPMLTPYILTAVLFRLLDSIQQFDIIYAMTQGGPRQRADRVPGRGLPQLLPADQRRALDGAPDDPVGHHVRALQRLHQDLAAPARAGAGGGLGWIAPRRSSGRCGGSRSPSS